MVLLWSLIFLVIISSFTFGVYSQLDANGFLSIDCGIPSNTSYVDPGTNLTYVSDEQFTDTGVNFQISTSLPRVFQTVRSFPTGIRNCYTIRSLTPGFQYLIRATFIYTNYDNLDRPPIFDIYLGVNFWVTVNASSSFYPEIIVKTTTDYREVCLVNKNLGNPFISTLHFRQLNSKLYQEVNANQSLISLRRINLGGSKSGSFIRYPEDKYDRWWFTETLNGTTEISSNSTIQPDPDETPSLVMQTAATTSSTQQPLNLYWSVDDKSSRYYWIFHFYEIQTSSIGQREFDLFINGAKANDTIILQTWYRITLERSGFTNYNASLVATSNSTLPPLLNGYELYKIAPVGDTTYSADVAAINVIKKDHQIKNGWSGDPCLPKDFIWSGVSCTSNSSNISRITGLNLSSSGLIGPLSYYFGNLVALVSLDLSGNDLSGSLPSSLDQLTALEYLDIRGNNKMSTNLPFGLQKRQQNGSLTYRFGDLPIPSPSRSPSSKKNIIISTAVVVPLFVIAVVVASIHWLRRKYNQSSPVTNDSARSDGAISHQPKAAARDFHIIDNCEFSYNDLKNITNDFKNIIGTGGFGSVYLGHLEDGFQVAVKMRSNSSSQGIKEFLAEAKHLARVHHKNLVTLIGYCIEENCMALVYEYMQEGNLHEKLKDIYVTPLTWKQRLKIAYQSALGLEYLHKACNPPLIHRDIKASNILLNANFEAKIADFGLSRAFESDAISYVSTKVIGTPGYLDPEYYSSNQLSGKSDVYSFGVVLLEIVTGQSPTNVGLEGDNLVQWVREKLSGGNIETIVDPRMQEEYDINSIWKVTDLACRCTEPTSSKRPAMDAVVSELKESMYLEFPTEKMHNESSTDNLVTDVSDDSAFEIASTGDISDPGPIVR